MCHLSGQLDSRKWLDRYWALKKAMAEGSEPLHVTRLLELLRPLACGLSLCGAGGGGFLVMVLRRDASLEQVSEALRVHRAREPDEQGEATLHRVSIDMEGLVVKTVPSRGGDLSEYFFQAGGN